MKVTLVKVVSRGQKNTRWQFTDCSGSLFDGLLSTSGDYRVGQELEKDSFSSIRAVSNRSSCPVNQPGVESSIAQTFAIPGAGSAQVSSYVNVLTGEVVAADMTEAEFETLLESEL